MVDALVFKQHMQRCRYLLGGLHIMIEKLLIKRITEDIWNLLAHVQKNYLCMKKLRNLCGSFHNLDGAWRLVDCR